MRFEIYTAVKRWIVFLCARACRLQIQMEVVRPSELLKTPYKTT
jgi:hypothetical protein